MSTAISGALHSPLLCDTDILSARSLLFAFYYSHDIDPPYKVSESSEINRLIAEMNKRVEVIFGWGYDDTLGNKIKFTILASGFDVSLQSAGSNESHGVIEGVAETTGSSSTIDNRIIDAYGKDKVDDLIRIQETQNYYILKPDQLDSDDAIDMVERNPAFKRDKRKLAAAKTEPETRHQDERSQNNSNQITFSPDDR